MVVGAAVVASSDDDDEKTTTTTTQAALPCDPTVSNVNSTTYYKCGTQYYVQAYGGSGPIYMPVAPPIPEVAPAAAPAPP